MRVPGGFATTADAFHDFLRHNAEGGPSVGERIAQRLKGLDVDNVRSLAATGAEIRQWIFETQRDAVTNAPMSPRDRLCKVFLGPDVSKANRKAKK